MCRFLVNGYRSSGRDVTCGIRQGCPLAPLPFFLALDSVYRVLYEREDIRGIPITSGGRTTEFKARDMLMILVYNFAIGLQFCPLSLLSMTSLSCPVFGQIGLNQWSPSWVRADPRNLSVHVVSLY